MRKWIVAALVTLIAGLGALVLTGLSDFERYRFDWIQLSFQSDGNTLSGSLILPQDAADPPIALIVHGDGPQDRFAGDSYLPLINTFLDAGIAVFSWDKPGVGSSDGNWLDQTMDARTNEVLAARAMLLARLQTADAQIGFVGFSQAGWVIPRVTHDLTPGFSVLVGAAVSWQRQGDYYTRTRLRGEGVGIADIDTMIAVGQVRDDVLFQPGYTPTSAELAGMSHDRYGFVGRNRFSDASLDLGRMQGPVLAIWGANDLNVDPLANAADYQRLLPDPGTQQVIVIPGATHGLLRARPFNYQLVDQWPRPTQWAFAALGRRAYAPDALPQITDWINAQVR